MNQTRFRKRCAASVAAVSLLAMSSFARAATLSSAAPGNIFLEKQPLLFSVNEARGAVALSLREYSGRVVWEGSGTSNVSIPAQVPGWYELAARDESGETQVSLGVLIDRKNAPLPFASRICADAASAWLVKDAAQRRPFARMVRLAGISWVRERISWASSQKNGGEFTWGKEYEETAAAFKAEGVNVYEIWHDAPQWARIQPGGGSRFAPDDLRTVYSFARTAASHFSATKAWEVWNEPDIGFWSGLSDSFAGMQKAAYWGFKDSTAKPLVLSGSFALGPSDFTRNFFENGGAEYADVLNWHRYADPATYPGGLSEHRASAKAAGAGEKPWWLTEAGVPLPGPESQGRMLNAEHQRIQARYMPRAAAMSIAAGNTKYFFFVLPHYPENGAQFGAIRPDLTPYPGFVTLSAAANILGVSDYAGTVSAPAGITAQAFDTPQGRVVVAWSEKPQTLSLPTSGAVTVHNMFGAASTRVAQNRQVAVEVGPDAVYIRGVAPVVTPPAPGILPASVLKKTAAPRVAAAPSRVVIVGYANLPTDKGRDAYPLSLGALPRRDNVPAASTETATTPEKTALDPSLTYYVQVYNFDAKVTRVGAIAPQVPAGWRVSPARQSVELAPMERRVLTFALTPPVPSNEVHSVRVVGIFAGQKVSPSISRFVVTP